MMKMIMINLFRLKSSRISDRVSQPSVLCLVQYVGVESDLHGGARDIQPGIIYLLDFGLKAWHVFERQSADYIHYSYIHELLENFKDKTMDKSLNDLFLKIADNVVNNVINTIKY